MFEKEADYMKAKKESKDKITEVISAWSAREETIHDIGFQKGAEFGYNKANEEIREELLELKANSFDAGMFLRVDETLRKLGIKED